MTGAFRRLAAEPARHRVADRNWLSVGVAIAGSVLLFLGWWGASGAATVSEQLPYLASGSIPGAALVIAAAILLSRESALHAARRTDALISELHSLLVEEVAAAPATTAAAVPAVLDGHVAVSGGERFHRPDCLLIAGKDGVEVVDTATIAQRKLSACDVCEPDRPAA
jgi:hypothetical protein